MKDATDSQEICIIRTYECELCLRFDSIMLPREELLEKVLNNSMKIGTHLISHGDHMRIIYFNEEAEYLGDVISLNIVKSQDQINKSILPIFGKEKINSKKDIRFRLLNTFLSKDLSICIVGPSYVGKTSLSILMDSGIPERNNGFTRRSPTLHKATKRIKLGRTRLTIHDMGGQTDFWDGWKDVIPYADKIIFMVDGSANTPQLSAQALDLVLSSRINNCPVLFLMNKYDILLDGYLDSFTQDHEVISNLLSKNIDNIWAVNTSVYNGICYNFEGKNEEVELQIVLNKFIKS